MTYIDRYLSGEDVWQELIDHGDRVTTDPLQSEAYQIASTIVGRAKHNIEVLIDRLGRIGYRFGWHDDSSPIPYYRGPLTDASPATRATIDHIEEVAGPLPILFRVWCESMEEVDFSGFHPEWDSEYPDPLVVSCPGAPYVDELYSEWKMEESGELFRLEFAPDFYHKANVSGGGPYSIELPNSSIDSLVLEEPHGLYFLPYLRLCMKWGGFPGLAGLANGIPPSHLSFLTEGLLPL